jgi:hypothetical protein
MSDKNGKIGSSFEDFLKEEGLYEEVVATVKKRITRENPIMVKLTKINKQKNPAYETSSISDWKHGEENGLSPFVGYQVKGSLLSKPVVGGSIEIFREIRNGDKVPGIFRSSKILKIEGNLIHTLNSVYKIEK